MARPRFLILGIWRLSKEVEIDVLIITSLRAYSPHWLGAHDIITVKYLQFQTKTFDIPLYIDITALNTPHSRCLKGSVRHFTIAADISMLMY